MMGKYYRNGSKKLIVFMKLIIVFFLDIDVKDFWLDERDFFLLRRIGCFFDCGSFKMLKYEIYMYFKMFEIWLIVFGFRVEFLNFFFEGI